MQYLPVADIDLARLDLHMRQISVDVAVDDAGAVASGVVEAGATWDRVANTVEPEFAIAVENQLGELFVAVDDGDREKADELATELRDLLAEL